MSATAVGMTTIVIAGVIGSATLLPMKFVRRWEWENTWLLYAAHAYLIFPLIVAWWTIPQLGSVYVEAGWSQVWPVVAYGFGWGISVVMLGLAVASMGLAVSTGIIMGSSIALGSLIPLLWLEADAVTAGQTTRVLVADGLILLGVALCARAGYVRERDQNRAAAQGAGGDASAARGIAICLAAGVLTTLLNLALASGREIARIAVAAGAAENDAANAVWGLAVSAGAMPSLIYCLVLLYRNRSWNHFRSTERVRNAVICVAMAAFFITATVGYGMGAVRMGDLGPAIGWPVYISTLIIGNNWWGWLTSEWRGAPPSAFSTMLAGVALQVAGILFLSLGGG
ncbi:L-rhamnose/proton symporter RhaT [Botrimarina sp.]|uniref:L-rhamnose/proton symporter RhaT n=1 Tax=Botrimarina sp. TaxID=2795802 RepID=UPI0032EAE449